MKNAKKLLAKLMICALIIAYIPAPSIQSSAASNKVSTKMYTLSQKAGTYSSAISVTIKAKKGYKVYYTTGSTLTIKKVIKSGKSKTIKISKTTTLKIYAVKKSTIITKKKLKTSKVVKKAKSYKYTIKAQDSTATDTQTSTTTATTTAASSEEKTSSEQASLAPASSESMTSEQSTKSSEEEKVQDKIDETATTAENAGSTETAAGNDASYNSDTTANSIDTTTLNTTYTNLSNGTTEEGFSYEDGTLTYSDDNISYTYKPSSTEEGGTVTAGTLKFTKDGDYEITGTLNNTLISFSKCTGTLKLNGVTIDNSELTSNEPVIQFYKKAASATLIIEGDNTITGAGAYDNSYNTKENEPGEPAPIIKYNNANGTLLVTGDENSSLSINDGMSQDTSYYSFSSDTATSADYEVDPSSGISTKGAIVIDTNGTLTINVNGNALNAKAEANMEKDESGNESFKVYTSGGITIKNGTLNLTSNLSKGINSKYGLITIAGGTTNITTAKDDAVKAKNYNVQITGGTLNIKNCGGDGIRAAGNVTVTGGTTTIDKCYGDGIQAENIEITAGTVDIKTYYEYAATNFRSTNWSGKVNSMAESGSTKTETVNYDTGSHCALKAGTKAKTYKYTTINDASTGLTADTEYTQEASGSLIITGGTITLDTTNTGIKYNGGSSSGGFGGGDSQSVIGSPDDAIHSNNTAIISGGTITISASDDGITCANELNILDSADITIKTAYEGIESGTITIGKSSSSTFNPSVSVYSNDDGINASSKSSTIYTYANENEETYTKKTTSGSNNTLTITAGNVYVEIADDQTHSVTLSGTSSDGSGTKTYTFSADGDGLDSNGSFYAYGGTIVTIGGTSNGNGVFDRDGNFVIGSGVTLFGIGTNGMVEGPTEVEQPYIEYGNNRSSGGGPGNFGSFGGNSSSSGNSAIASGSTITISDSNGNTIYTYTTKKSASYILYSSPKLTSGSSYTVKSGTTTLATLTATTSASSGGAGSSTPPTPPSN